ncbi:hypothetical protein SAMN05421805_12515 [Saccharopolyspora antimicrobica]|uniref:Butirosin biosynthesis protein H, N-terminal n=1 Tax=Saccharopolyspora antimicrobica TaxID=455193 RepID=A0A1I5K2Y5_9PSEU|nr:hypothetical protein [Saccharopolyspora antimicrobica]RKT84756.1 hypothetical protein ATL45_3080 [Saccharopolyspora antimicrobica]SFO79093.1 hypothetical protein SAMN05421805_12515 [Saccharopolyspora antimicrobica]
MMFGSGAPDVGVVETVTGSPFGMQLAGPELPFFDPPGWDPGIGVDDALAAFGWVAETTSGGSADAALARLAERVAVGPVMVGPVEMGHLRYQPSMTGPIGADHYVVVLGIDDEHVHLHDPQGYPHSRLPVADFVAAWRADTVDYGEPFTLRADFRRTAQVEPEAAIRASLDRARHWLRAGSGDAALGLAEQVEAGCSADLRGHLVHFAVRVGTRRLADAATCLQRIGSTGAAAVASEQARLVGSLQHPLVIGEDREAAGILRELAPTYDALRRQLA